MNKKAATLQNWTEGIIIAVLFVIVFGIIIIDMNELYDEDYIIAGLETDALQESINAYQEGIEEKYRGGEISFLDQVGMTLGTSWDIISSTMSLIWQFISFGWIETIATDYMRLPRIVGLIFRILFFISIGFIILRLLFKVKA